MPTNQDLTSAEVRLLTGAEGREQRLREALAPVRGNYEVIIIDCPPSLNMLTLNALVAADSVIVPMQCEYYALEGLSALTATIEQVRDAVNPALHIEGILRTMYDPRNNLSTEVSAQLMQHFGDVVFRTVIPRNVRLAEAPSFGKPALLHDKDSRGALAYLALAGEMIRREEEAQEWPARPPTPARKHCRFRSGDVSEKKPALGRGLADLLGASRARAATPAAPVPVAPAAKAVPAPRGGGDELAHLPLDVLQRGKYQPRVDMRQEALEELAISIRNQGLIQPIVVRPLQEADTTGRGSTARYEIIAGERRWRAAQIAGLKTIPAIIRRVPDDAAIAMALIENIQREDLNPLEEARALERLIAEFGVTHSQAADAVGRSRASVSNLLRLLELAPEVSMMVEKRQLEMGHARALLGLANRRQQVQLAEQVAREGLSVRVTEALVRKLSAPAETPRRPVSAASHKIDPNVTALQQDLTERLGAKVLIQQGSGGKGKLIVSYNSLEELDGILGHIR